jgi:hypothetical protein
MKVVEGGLLAEVKPSVVLVTLATPDIVDIAN